MTNQERKYISDANAWEVFVGGVTAQEFCRGFSSPRAAINHYFDNYPFDEKPSWLYGALIGYIETEARADFDNVDWFTATLEACQPE